MAKRYSFALVSITVFSVAVAMRTIPLYWSPLPFNLDGFHHAALARETLSHGFLPVSQSYFKPDEYIFASLLAIASSITGISPLYIGQILIANIGATVCLFVVDITRRIGNRLRWSELDVQVASLVTGFVLATEGIFLGRSTAVTSEGVGHLFVIASIFVFAHALWTSRRSWLLLAALLFFVLPLTHNLSSIIGMITAISLIALYLRNTPTDPNFAAGTLAIGFWIYAGIYYTVAELGKVRMISSTPGLFFAWIIVLTFSVIWISTIQLQYQRGVPLTILVGGSGLLIINHIVPIFPGTASGKLLTLLFILPIAAVGVLAFWGIPSITAVRVEGYAVFALLVGTLSLIGFALTAGLTFPYQDLAIRGHIFLHIAFAVLAGLSTIIIDREWKKYDLLKILPAFLVICSAVSAPLAFSGLHATSAQPLVTQSEFETATFATKHADQWTSDGHIAKLASDFYPTQSTGSQKSVFSWLHANGSRPNCPIISQRSWVTVGAQLFPSSPEQVSANSYNKILYSRNLVYTTSGGDPLVLTIPPNRKISTC